MQSKHGARASGKRFVEGRLQANSSREVWKKKQAQGHVAQGRERLVRSLNFILCAGPAVKVSHRSEYLQKTPLVAMWRTGQRGQCQREGDSASFILRPALSVLSFVNEETEGAKGEWVA